jgi:hypothetical protein
MTSPKEEEEEEEEEENLMSGVTMKVLLFVQSIDTQLTNKESARQQLKLILRSLPLWDMR